MEMASPGFTAGPARPVWMPRVPLRRVERSESHRQDIHALKQPKKVVNPHTGAHTATCSRQLQTSSTAAKRRQTRPAVPPASGAAAWMAEATRPTLPATRFACRRPYSPLNVAYLWVGESMKMSDFDSAISCMGIREGVLGITAEVIWRSEAAGKLSYGAVKMLTY